MNKVTQRQDEWEEVPITSASHGGEWEEIPLPKNRGMKTLDVAGPAQSFLEHAGNAATLGYLPQIQSLIGGMAPDPNAALDKKQASEGFMVSAPQDTYITRRDENLRRQATEGAEPPLASRLGPGAGVAASLLIPAGKVAEGANLAQRLYSGAKTGL